MVHVAKEMEREGFDGPAPDRRAPPPASSTRRSRSPQNYSRPGGPRQGRIEERRRRRPPEPARDPARDRPREPRGPGKGAGRVRPQGPSGSSSPTQEALAPSIRRRLVDRPDRPSRRSSGPRCSATCPLGEIVPFIDWSPFFMAWELKGKYPAILKRPRRSAPSPRDLFQDATDAPRPDRGARSSCPGQRGLRLLPRQLRRR